LLKANFKIKKDDEEEKTIKQHDTEPRDITEEEFEDYIVKSGAAGSFMVFRNFKKKQDELGLDEI